MRAVKRLKASRVERVADPLHQLVVEIEVVKHAKAHSERLARLEEMADIGARIASAGRAFARGVDRLRVGKILFVIDVHLAVPGKEISVPRVSARHDAIKEVDAAAYRLEKVLGRSDTHQIARLVFGHMRFDRFDDVVHHLGFLPDGKTADGIAREIKLGRALHAFNTQILIGPPLPDAKEELIRVDGSLLAVETLELCLASCEPAKGTLH